jgi:hypothetical protein
VSRSEESDQLAQLNEPNIPFVRKLGRQLIVVLSALCVVAAMAGPASAAPRRTPRPPRPPRNGRPPRVHLGGVLDTQSGSSGIKLPPTNAYAYYWGGPVIQHVHVVGVRYGDPANATFLPQLTGAAPSVDSFLSGLPNSSFMDLLSEYGAGNQVIGRGSYGGMYTITPSTPSDQPIDDSQIQAELDAQAGAALPAADADTLYVLFFPEGQKITADGADSFANFCAYHGTTAGKHLRYAVLPYRASDTDPTAGITGSCGKSPGLSNFTAALTHEFAEAVTDPDVSLATSLGSPVAWYDQKQPNSIGGEIGDLCNQVDSKLLLADGFKYTLETVWSNQQRKCAVSGPVRTIAVGDAAIAEGDQGTREMHIPVTLSETSHIPIDVYYSITPSGAHPADGSDFYDSGSGKLTFPMVSTSKSATVEYVKLQVVGDTNAEPDETFTVSIDTETPGYGLERASGTGTIINDDPSAGLAASIGDTTTVVPQGKTKNVVDIPITLNQVNGADTLVEFEILAGTASGTDFSGPKHGALRIPAGSLVGYISYKVKPHLDAGSDKSFVITLIDTSAGSITRNHGTVTLLKA